METPVSSSSPVFVSTRISRTSSAPGSEGGRVKTPSTSVTKTADLAASSLQSSTIQTSPLRIAAPCAASRTASPCTTGTRPCLRRPTMPEVAGDGSPESGSSFFTVPTKGQGETATAGSPRAMRAVTTCLLNVVTDSRVLANPWHNLRGMGCGGAPSPVPFDTPYSLACWWPNDPAPWITAKRVPSAASCDSWAAVAPSASTLSVSNCAFLVQAEPPIFTTTSAQGTVPLLGWSSRSGKHPRRAPICPRAHAGVEAPQKG
mmetsp:Transcript_89615/g.267280  ORF Transcript_89615/g.267280 Transcript_89615/m.267280 type:complete len:260 (-) Transcript_89615:25-804(-)